MTLDFDVWDGSGCRDYEQSMKNVGIDNRFEVYADSVREEMLQFVPTTAKRILDVGCSVGNFGALLKSTLGAEVSGVESDIHAAQVAKTKLDHVYAEDFSSKLDLPEGYFDCVVFNDVLEHMVDPYEALLYARRLLNEDGVVVASIPNVRYFGNIWLLLVHKSWEYVDTGILDRTHLRFFTKRSIETAFERLDFQIQSIDGINSLESQEPHFIPKFRILNLLTFGAINDMRWLQFAVVARPRIIEP